jgi:hypothetical protein
MQNNQKSHNDLYCCFVLSFEKSAAEFLCGLANPLKKTAFARAPISLSFGRGLS